MTIEVNHRSFKDEVLQSDTPVLVDFYASWCGPCKSLAPHLETYAAEAEGQVKVVKVDIEEGTWPTNTASATCPPSSCSRTAASSTAVWAGDHRRREALRRGALRR
ncbi:thioredoxin family protein [Nannocystis pusilla]|uniref:thioredoxin family protein n=1 Tax=Nannocystis pusilla TaxID=889268 RepID=UPI003B7E974E